MKNLKLRLIVMNFLEFAVWGAYLTCMGNYLGKAGMGSEIAWFYAIQGIVSIFMPTLMGIVADKYIQPQRLLGICHAVAGMAMIGLACMGMANPMPNKAAFIALYTLSVAFYMPTLALSNTVAFTLLKDNGMDTVDANLALGLPADARDYHCGIQILKELGVSKIRLMTNNPKKIDGLTSGDHTLEITERVPLQLPVREQDKFYMKTKATRMGHLLNI